MIDNEYDDGYEGGHVPRPRLSLAPRASAAGRTVFLVEDEDEKALVQAEEELAALIGGPSGELEEWDVTPLTDTLAVVVGNNHGLGYDLAAACCRRLRPVARSVRVVAPVAGCEELADHVAAGHSLADLVEVPLAVVEMGVGALPLDFGEVAEATTGQPDWLIHGVLERGRSHVLFAWAKVGKSLLALAMALALATGRPFLGVAAVGRPVRVLYLDMENAPADVGERLAAMGYRPEELASLVFLSFPALPPLNTAEGGRALVGLVEYHDAEVVVLDTVGRFLEGEEDKATTYQQLYRHTLVHLKARGVTVLRLDHAGNEGSRQRGSSAKAEDADTVWRFDKKGTDRLRLVCTHQRTGHHPDEIDLVRGGQPLDHRLRDAEVVAPEVAEVRAHLDRLGVAATAGRDGCRKALVDAGVKINNTTLAEAVRLRKKAFETCPPASRTGRSDSTVPKINNTCPPASGPSTISPAQSRPGQVADSADNTAPVQDA